MHKDVACIHTYIHIYIYAISVYELSYIYIYELPWWLSDKESICLYRRWRNMSHIPGSGRSLGEENGKPLQYTCWENPMDRGAWRATVHGVSKSKIWLSTHSPPHTHTHIHTMEYYSAIKKNEIMPFAATWMDLETVILSEVRKRTNTRQYHLYVES